MRASSSAGGSSRLGEVLTFKEAAKLKGTAMMAAESDGVGNGVFSIEEAVPVDSVKEG